MLQGADTQPEAKREIRAALDSRTGVSTTLKNYRRDGSLYNCQLSITPIRHGEGTIGYFLGIARDMG